MARPIGNDSTNNFYEKSIRSGAHALHHLFGEQRSPVAFAFRPILIPDDDNGVLSRLSRWIRWVLGDANSEHLDDGD